MSCYWWMNLAFFIAGFWTVFAIGNYFIYRHRLGELNRQLKLMQSEYYQLYLGPRRWNTTN